MISDLQYFFSKINAGKRHKGKMIWIKDLKEKYFQTSWRKRKFSSGI